MKKIILIFLVSFFAVYTVNAQLDRSQRPQPGPAPTIQLGDFESFTLDNGLQVIVVENRRIPVISFQLTLNIDPYTEGDAKGYVDMAGQLMREGTTNRSKEEIDEAVDFIGANLSTFSTGMFASSLTRHSDALLDLMSDILLNPTFPQEELERRITQTRSGLQTIRTDGSSIARNVSMTQTFGPDHPYGEVVTEATLDNINVDLLRNYYNTYWKPNVAYMVIVGDIDAAEARNLMNRYFGSWQRGDVPTHTYPTPTPPAARRVAFAERPGATQSVVQITYPVVLPVGHEDAIKVSVMNGILGGGVFSGRLMQNIREDKGWTYGIRSNITNDRIVGRFIASTEVRNSVTDSTAIEILGEMSRLINEPVTDRDLELVKNFMTGQFARSLESPRTIANFALNIKRFGLPEDYYATYLEKLHAVTIEDVQQMARKYLKPDNSIIVVAGNKADVVESLEKLSHTGTVEIFDAFGAPFQESALREVPAGFTAQNVFEKYINAIGGRENVSNISELKIVGKASVQGMEITLTNFMKAPNKVRSEQAMGAQVMGTQVFNGEKAIISQMGQKMEFTEGAEFDAFKLQSMMFMEKDYSKLGMNPVLLGIETVDGKDAYKIEIEGPGGTKVYYYYAVETGLKIRMETGEGFSTFSDYRKVDNVKFPHVQTQQMGPMIIEVVTQEVQINPGFDSSLFEL